MPPKFRFFFENCQLKRSDMSTWLKDNQPQNRKRQFVHLRCTQKLIQSSQRDLKINNIVCPCWWLVSQLYHLLPPTTTQLCLHHLLNTCFALFKNDDLVHQNRRPVTTGAQTHMQNPVHTKDLSQIVKVSSNGIQKHSFHTPTSKWAQYAVVIIQQKK